jgi:hypothetical protein
MGWPLPSLKHRSGSIRLPLFVMRPIAPRPILGMGDELPLHRIPMHVVQLLLLFVLAPHIEVRELVHD